MFQGGGALKREGVVSGEGIRQGVVCWPVGPMREFVEEVKRGCFGERGRICNKK